MATKTRIEKDSLGEMHVPVDKYWGAQTQRSLTNFNIGKEIVSLDLIKAVAVTKWAAASANEKCHKIDHTRANLIRRACEEIIAGKLDVNFPTHAYQAGSGTQTNMNVNEV
ncbi:MAG: class II fumarate hydratase, partial [Mycoplasmataceae bacterium]|nr:class II fumarate hydratase [Mycoplasmataceae bacterium]